MDGPSPASMCVLASGSGGNCTVIAVGDGDARRVMLIDAGLSPRRTRRLLGDLDLSMEQVRVVLLTHLDTDHWRWSWRGELPEAARVFLSGTHLAAGRRAGWLPPSASAWDGDFEAMNGVGVRPLHMDHDDLGVSAFRIEIGGGTLGFATDLGRVTAPLIELLRGVEVLAIESNYCTRMQVGSARPWFLKKRIMGGRGHLSNDEAARAVEAIAPRRHVVFLHLSRECNRPSLVADLHRGGDYEFTISEQFAPTRWVRLTRTPAAQVYPRSLWEAPR
ncbi:MAG: MBL fold metallo-hydrolase [Phycisphaerales bacterium]|nr:MBL fold metallo-hydrolase [Phycisphaerales bacterium]